VLPVTRIPVYDATAPIVCTIDVAEAPARRALIERIRASVLGVERTPDGLVLQLPPEREADARGFAIEEKRCCGFWGFEVTLEGNAVTLCWDGPPDVAPLFEQLAAFFRGEADLDTITALLLGRSTVARERPIGRRDTTMPRPSAAKAGNSCVGSPIRARSGASCGGRLPAG